jgi:hypothetical protein
MIVLRKFFSLFSPRTPLSPNLRSYLSLTHLFLFLIVPSLIPYSVPCVFSFSIILFFIFFFSPSSIPSSHTFSIFFSSNSSSYSQFSSFRTSSKSTQSSFPSTSSFLGPPPNVSFTSLTSSFASRARICKRIRSPIFHQLI